MLHKDLIYLRPVADLASDLGVPATPEQPVEKEETLFETLSNLLPNPKSITFDNVVQHIALAENIYANVREQVGRIFITDWVKSVAFKLGSEVKNLEQAQLLIRTIYNLKKIIPRETGQIYIIYALRMAASAVESISELIDIIVFLRKQKIINPAVPLEPNQIESISYEGFQKITTLILTMKDLEGLIDLLLNCDQQFVIPEISLNEMPKILAQTALRLMAHDPQISIDAIKQMINKKLEFGYRDWTVFDNIVGY